MKMIIDKNVLLNSLNSVSKALSTRNIIPVLNKVMKKVVIIAKDDNVLVGGESEVNRNDPGTFGEVKNRIGF